jgi:hypothetical protein
MKNTNIRSAARDAETLQTRFAFRLASRLSEAAVQTPADVQERLRFARERALERAREGRAATAPTAVQVLGSTLALSGGPERSPWWMRVASVLPLVVLLAGLTLIQHRYARVQIEAAAEIDAEILSDAVPPVAYSDPGFAEYLKYPLE